MIEYEGQAVAAPSDPNDGSLGSDYYFTQAANGQVVETKVDPAEDQYYRNMKLSAINTFHTLVAEGRSVIVEKDVVGTHRSAYNGEKPKAGELELEQAGTALLISKTFTEADVSKWADANVSAGSVHFDSSASASLHADGYISHATSNQIAVLVNVSANAPKLLARRTTALSRQRLGGSGGNGANTTTIGFDSNLWTTGGAASALNMVEWGVSDGRLGKVTADWRTTNHGAQLITTTLLAEATKHARRASARGRSVPIKRALAALFEGQNTAAGRSLSSTNADLSSLARTLGEREMRQLFRSETIARAFGAADERRSRELCQRAMFVLASAAMGGGSPAAETLLLELGLAAADPRTRLSAAMHLGSLDESSGSARSAAAVARTRAALARAAADEAEHEDVRAAAAVGARTEKERAELERSAIESLPFNRSWDGAVKFGGKVINVAFDAATIAGTNFNCKHQFFNYEASAIARANISLFGWTKQAVRAEAQYGKIYGAALDDVISLKVWDKTVYSKALPADPDCSPQTHDLYHKAPGLDKSFTLWVSIIPITMTATVSTDIDVTWGWSACDAKMMARVWIVSDPSISVMGSVELGLLVLQATTEVDGSFNTGIRPHGFIDGSLCDLGFEVDSLSQAQSANFHSFYRARKCKWEWKAPFLKCTWEPAKDKSWWSWAEPAKKKDLLNHTWPIKKP